MKILITFAAGDCLVTPAFTQPMNPPAALWRGPAVPIWKVARPPLPATCLVSRETGQVVLWSRNVRTLSEVTRQHSVDVNGTVIRGAFDRVV
jgi:hypothetical protein